MSTQLLAQALAVAANPHSDTNQLMDAAGDLVAFGAFEAADRAMARLRQLGAPAAPFASLERTLAWMRRLGPQFEERFLRGAIAAVHDPKATAEQIARAAESLVVWGCLDEADKGIERLGESGVQSARVARLAAASRQLRRSGVLQELSALTPKTSLNKPFEVLVRRKDGASRTIVVFTGVAKRFWISLNTLHVFLRKLDANVIYLNDQSASMFVNGLASVGPGYGNMLKVLREQLAALRGEGPGDNSLHVLATSAGGFIGLRTAIDLRADSFAGMSIRTTLADDGQVLMTPFERYAIRQCRDPAMLVDLRPILTASAFPRRIQLYCGDSNPFDMSHAKHLGGIPRVDITYIDDYRAHDTVGELIARGTFGEMLTRFVAPTAASPEEIGA